MGAMTAWGRRRECILPRPVNLTESKARAATQRACTPALAAPEPPRQAGGGPYSFPYRRVKGGCCGHGLGSSAAAATCLTASWSLYAVSGLGTFIGMEFLKLEKCLLNLCPDAETDAVFTAVLSAAADKPQFHADLETAAVQGRAGFT